MPKRKFGGRFYKLFLTINETQYELCLANPEHTVRSLMTQIGQRLNVQVDGVFVQTNYRVDPQYKVGDAFDYGERVNITTSKLIARQDDPEHKQDKKREVKQEKKMDDLIQKLKEFASSSDSLDSGEEKVVVQVRAGSLSSSVEVDAKKPESDLSSSPKNKSSSSNAEYAQYLNVGKQESSLSSEEKPKKIIKHKAKEKFPNLF